MIKKIFIVLILFSFLILNTQAKTKKTVQNPPFHKLVAKSPELIKKELKIAPYSTIPILNIFITNGFFLDIYDDEHWHGDFIREQDAIFELEDEAKVQKMLSENGVSDKNIKKILEYKYSYNSLLENTSFLYAKNPKKYRYKQKIVKKALKKKNLTEDELVELIIKKSKTKTEKIKEAPIVGNVIKGVDYVFFVPAYFIPFFVYKNVYDDWYDEVKYLNFINEN